MLRELSFWISLELERVVPRRVWRVMPGPEPVRSEPKSRNSLGDTRQFGLYIHQGDEPSPVFDIATT